MKNSGRAGFPDSAAANNFAGTYRRNNSDAGGEAFPADSSRTSSGLRPASEPDKAVGMTVVSCF
jgi:hypothetical protein